MQLNNNDEQTAAVRRELENRSARVSWRGSAFDPDKLRWLMSDRDKWREVLSRNLFQISSGST